ncbi:GM19548 [Drosophila sechellia]|uniref:GD17835 n=2 Tax=melanogaster subgroup TaxID=32351 RepID=B4Q553_DROSI|nr:GM19548 [Drosophila sechellia]EDX04959.1 GD17835 [Drosophila simulans]
MEGGLWEAQNRSRQQQGEKNGHQWRQLLLVASATAPSWRAGAFPRHPVSVAVPVFLCFCHSVAFGSVRWFDVWARSVPTCFLLGVIQKHFAAKQNG